MNRIAHEFECRLNWAVDPIGEEENQNG
jgi:hypothetical protein